MHNEPINKIKITLKFSLLLKNKEIMKTNIRQRYIDLLCKKIREKEINKIKNKYRFILTLFESNINLQNAYHAVISDNVEKLKNRSACAPVGEFIVNENFVKKSLKNQKKINTRVI